MRKWKNPILRKTIKEIFKYVNPPKLNMDIISFKNEIEKKYPELKNLLPLFWEHNIDVYLVGGSIRDWLLGKKNLDLDLTLNTDVTRLNPNIFTKIGIKEIKKFPQFLTAKFIFKNNSLDLASFRKEKYLSPGKLPQTQFTPKLEEDVQRRDFTINSIYLKISPPLKLLDPSQKGIPDLKEGIIRILHPLSFQNDPTRILRGLRFAINFNFKWEKKTEILLKKAIISYYLSYISGTRFFKEIRKLSTSIPFKHLILALCHWKIFSSFTQTELKDKEIEKKMEEIWETKIPHSISFKTLFLAFFTFLFQETMELKEIKNYFTLFEAKQKILKNWKYHSFTQILFLFSQYFEK